MNDEQDNKPLTAREPKPNKTKDVTKAMDTYAAALLESHEALMAVAEAAGLSEEAFERELGELKQLGRRPLVLSHVAPQCSRMVAPQA